MKYKVGQKVKVVACLNGHGFELNETITIDKVNDDNYDCTNGTHKWALNDNEIETIKIYVSGKITGLPIELAKKLFDDATEKLEMEGFNVVNPMTLNHAHDLSWENYMRVDLMALLKCSHIYMLKNWHTSKGANIEYNLAKDLNLTIIFE